MLLDEIQDPGNMGTLIRSAESSGFDGIILNGGCTDPYSPKCIRAATGAALHIPVIEIQEIEKASKMMNKNKFQVLGQRLKMASLTLR